MFSKLTVGIAATLAVSAVCSPFPSYTLEKRQAVPNNCTEYCSNDAGCTCTVRPSDCTAFYMVQPDDNCNTIAQSVGNITTTQLYKFNPSIGQTCFGLQAYVPICIDTPWYTFTPPGQASYGTIEAASQTPVPIQSNDNVNCTEYQLFGPGVDVFDSGLQNGYNASQFASWNGGQTAGWQNYWSCISVS